MLIRTVLRLMEQNAYSAIRGTLLRLIMSALRWIFYVKVTLCKTVSASLATLSMYYQTANASWVKICTFPSANRRTLKENAFNATIAITYPKTHVSLSLFCATPTTKYQENAPPVHQDTFSRTINASTLLWELIQGAHFTPTPTVQHASLVTTFKISSAGRSIPNVSILITLKTYAPSASTSILKELLVPDPGCIILILTILSVNSLAFFLILDFFENNNSLVSII